MKKINSIKAQLMTSFLVVMIIPILIIGSSAIHSSKEAIKSEMISYSSTMMGVLTENANYFTIEVDKEFDSYVLDQEFTKNIKSISKSSDSANTMNSLSRRLEQSIISTQFIQATIFIMDDKKIVSGDLKGANSSAYDKKALEEKGLVATIEEESGTTIWTYNSNGDKKLVAFRLINAGIGEKPLGILAFEINKEALEKRIFGNKVDHSQIQMILTTPQGEVILPTIDSQEETELIKRYPELFSTQEDYELTKLQEPIITKQNFIIYGACNNLEWRLIMSNPMSNMMGKVNQITTEIIFMALVLIGAAIIISLVISTSISKPIRHISDAMEVASRGDLTVTTQVKGSKEIIKLNESLMFMLKNISELLIQNKQVIQTVRVNAEYVKESANVTKECSKEINLAIEGIVVGAVKQNEEITSTNHEMEDLASGIDTILNKIGEATNLMQQSAEESKCAQKMMDVLNSKTLHASQKMEAIRGNINELKDMSQHIIEVVTMINQMSDTINLLSLNASIEAARAGEAGKGFAVVAGEVRKLAVESKKSSLMISNMIEAIQTKTDDTVKVANEVDNVFNEQKQSVSATNKTFKGLIITITDIHELMRYLDEFIANVHTNKDSVIGSTHNIHILVENLMASTEELLSNSNQQNESADHMNASSDQLLGNMSELERSINQFKLDCYTPY